MRILNEARASVFVFLVISIIIALSFSPVSGASIQGSKHDFSAPFMPSKSPYAGYFKIGGAPVTEICVFCHTPHNASSTQGLLWNRRSENYAGYTWQPYSSPTLSSVNNNVTPSGVSLMCMSCHDGITAIGANLLDNVTQVLLERPGSGNPNITFDTLASGADSDRLGDLFYEGSPMGTGANITNGWPGNTAQPLDMSNDHPVSIQYTGNSIIGSSPTDARLRLFNNKVECSTCHLVHDPANPPFLAMSNSSSNMCRACHNK